jgi:hypothetical protein
MKNLIKKIALWLNPPHQSELDRYVASKNPQNTAEVEFAIKQFDERNRVVNSLVHKGDYGTANYVRQTW